MAIVTSGIDLAKNVFALHGVDDTAEAALVRPKRAARQAAWSWSRRCRRA